MIERTAILGATTLAARELLERLGEHRSRLGRVALAEPEGDEVVASPVAGEWAVSTPIMEEALEDAGLVLCCAPLSEEAARVVRDAARRAVVIDLAGSLGGRAFDARPADRTRPVTLASLGPGVHASPAGASLLVAALARAARRAGSQGPCVAVALEPASELGREAIDELHAQTLAMLAFQPMTTDVFGRQAVHDVLSPGPRGEALEERLRRDAQQLGSGELSLIVLRPSLFHGTGVAMRAAVPASAWLREMRSERRLEIDADREGGVSPVGAVSAEAALVGRVVDDAAGGAWAWAAADTLAHGTVGNVVDVLAAS